MKDKIIGALIAEPPIPRGILGLHWEYSQWVLGIAGTKFPHPKYMVPVPVDSQCIPNAFPFHCWEWEWES